MKERMARGECVCVAGRGGGGDYLREAINRGTAIRGNTIKQRQGMKCCA